MAEVSKIHQVLYRLHRPQKFSEVVNQDAVKTTLKNAVAKQSPSHAYLFCGPRGVGKTSMARILARAVNCQSLSSGEPCGECESCLAISAGNFLDLVEIDAASNTGVDNIREVIDHVRFTPSSGKYKVIVIDEVHMLSKGAFNALLKTLEEPPAHAIFVLATTEIYKVPATIISRTQRFDFKRLTVKDIETQLAKVSQTLSVKVPEGSLPMIAKASEGSMRDALSLLDQLASFSSAKTTFAEVEQMLGLTSLASFRECFDALVSGQAGQATGFLKKAAQDGKDMVQFAHGFLAYSEMVLRSQLLGEQAELNITAEDGQHITKQAAAVSQKSLIHLLELFLNASNKVRTSPIPELPLVLAAVTFTQDTKVSINDFPTDQNKKEMDVDKENFKIPAEKASTKSVRIELDIVTNKWGEVMTKMREYNHSLISSLKLARVEGSEDGIILIFPYRFHKDAVEQRKNILIVEKVLEEVFGQPLHVTCKLEHEAASVGNPPVVRDGGIADNLMTEAVKVFGSSL